MTNTLRCSIFAVIAFACIACDEPHARGTARIDVDASEMRVRVRAPKVRFDRTFSLDRSGPLDHAGAPNEISDDLASTDLPMAVDTRWGSPEPDDESDLEYPVRLIRAAPPSTGLGLEVAVGIFRGKLGFYWFEVAPVEGDSTITLGLDPQMMYGRSPPAPWYFEIPRRLDGSEVPGQPRILLELAIPESGASREVRYLPASSSLFEEKEPPAFLPPGHAFSSLDEALAEIPDSLWSEILVLLKPSSSSSFGDIWQALVAFRRAGALYADFQPVGESEPREWELRLADADGSRGWFLSEEERLALDDVFGGGPR